MVSFFEGVVLLNFFVKSSMRFEGILNLDLNEITMNLVPYPELHFLMSSIVPLYSLCDTKLQPRKYHNISFFNSKFFNCKKCQNNKT